VQAVELLPFLPHLQLRARGGEAVTRLRGVRLARHGVRQLLAAPSHLHAANAKKSWEGSLRSPLTGPDPVSSTTPSGRRGLRVAKQGYLAPQDLSGAGSQVAFSFCRSLYALALLFPPKLSSHTVANRNGREQGAWWSCVVTLRAGRCVHTARPHPEVTGRRMGHTAMEKLRIVTVGISGGRSLTRPLRDARRSLHDGDLIRGLRVRRWV
jgi:hypothetical protein